MFSKLNALVFGAVVLMSGCRDTVPEISDEQLSDLLSTVDPMSFSQNPKPGISRDTLDCVKLLSGAADGDLDEVPEVSELFESECREDLGRLLADPARNPQGLSLDHFGDDTLVERVVALHAQQEAERSALREAQQVEEQRRREEEQRVAEDRRQAEAQRLEDERAAWRVEVEEALEAARAAFAATETQFRERVAHLRDLCGQLGAAFDALRAENRVHPALSGGGPCGMQVPYANVERNVDRYADWLAQAEVPGAPDAFYFQRSPEIDLDAIERTIELADARLTEIKAAIMDTTGQ